MINGLKKKRFKVISPELRNFLHDECKESNSLNSTIFTNEMFEQRKKTHKKTVLNKIPQNLLKK